MLAISDIWEIVGSPDFHLSMLRPFRIRISTVSRIAASGVSLLIEEMSKISARSSTYSPITSCARNSITMQIIYDRISKCSEVSPRPVRERGTGLIGNSDIGEIHLIILHARARFRWKIIVFELYAAEGCKSATYELARVPILLEGNYTVESGSALLMHAIIIYIFNRQKLILNINLYYNTSFLIYKLKNCFVDHDNYSESCRF